MANRELQRQVEGISVTLNEERKSTNDRLAALESAVLNGIIPEEKDSVNLGIKNLQTRIDKLESSSVKTTTADVYAPAVENIGFLKKEIKKIDSKQVESYQHIRNIENVLFTQMSPPQQDINFFECCC